MKYLLLVIVLILSLPSHAVTLQKHISGEVDITDFSKLVCKNKEKVKNQIVWFLKYESQLNLEEAYMINEGLNYGLTEKESEDMAERYYRGSRLYYKQQLESITENYLNCTSPQNGNITP